METAGFADLRARVATFRTAPRERRAELSAALADREAGALLGLAQAAAEEAVRRTDPAFLDEGLAALALQGGWPDWRDTLVVLSLLHRSAEKLGLDADALFRRAGEELAYEPVPERAYFEGAGAALLAAFAARPPELKTIEVMGHVEVETPEGLAYRWRTVAGAGGSSFTLLPADG